MRSRFKVQGSRFRMAGPEKAPVQSSAIPDLAVGSRLGTWNLELGTLFACAACYGKSDSPLANGMNWGIFTLLGVIVPVLGCFAFCFIRMINKDESSDKNKNAPENITDV